MSSEQEDKSYWDFVDRVIAEANAATEELEPGLVSAALLQAAARYNAFVVAASSIDRKEYIEEMEPAMQYLSSRYREYLHNNLDDYRENYKVYVRADQPDEE